MMRALIVDDEVHAREELQALLEETGEFHIVGNCANAFEALKAIKRDRPEVLFLDIQMPILSGFELVSMIDEEVMPIVIFVTAYDEYAVKAFEENALDYLLKPLEKQRLAKTVHKLKRMLGEGTRPAYEGPEIKRIPCVSSNRIKLIDISDVDYVRSDIAGVYVVQSCSQRDGACAHQGCQWRGLHIAHFVVRVKGRKMQRHVGAQLIHYPLAQGG